MLNTGDMLQVEHLPCGSGVIKFTCDGLVYIPSISGDSCDCPSPPIQLCPPRFKLKNVRYSLLGLISAWIKRNVIEMILLLQNCKGKLVVVKFGYHRNRRCCQVISQTNACNNYYGSNIFDNIIDGDFRVNIESFMYADGECCSSVFFEASNCFAKRVYEIKLDWHPEICGTSEPQCLTSIDGCTDVCSMFYKGKGRRPVLVGAPCDDKYPIYDACTKAVIFTSIYAPDGEYIFRRCSDIYILYMEDTCASFIKVTVPCPGDILSVFVDNIYIRIVWKECDQFIHYDCMVRPTSETKLWCIEECGNLVSYNLCTQARIEECIVGYDVFWAKVNELSCYQIQIVDACGVPVIVVLGRKKLLCGDSIGTAIGWHSGTNNLKCIDSTDIQTDCPLRAVIVGDDVAWGPCVWRNSSKCESEIVATCYAALSVDIRECDAVDNALTFKDGIVKFVKGSCETVILNGVAYVIMVDDELKCFAFIITSAPDDCPTTVTISHTWCDVYYIDAVEGLCVKICKTSARPTEADIIGKCKDFYVAMDSNILTHIDECVTIYHLKIECNSIQFTVETCVPSGGANVCSLRGTEDWFCWFSKLCTTSCCKVIDDAPMIKTDVAAITPTSSFYIPLKKEKIYGKYFSSIGVLVIRKSDGLYYIYAVVQSKKKNVDLKLWRKPCDEGSSLACGSECIGEDACLTVHFESCGFKTICLGSTRKSFCRYNTPPPSCKKCKCAPCSCAQPCVFNTQLLMSILNEWVVETKCTFFKAFDPGCNLDVLLLIDYVFPCECDTDGGSDKCTCTIYTATKGCDGTWVIQHWDVDKCPLSICATYTTRGCWSVSSVVYPLCC